MGTEDHLNQHLSEELIATLRDVSRFGAQRRSVGTYTDLDLRNAVGLGLLRTMTVAYGGCTIELVVPGPRLADYIGKRQIPLVPINALGMALAQERAKHLLEDNPEIQVSIRRHLIAMPAWGTRWDVHAVRPEGVSEKTIRRLMHDLVGGTHEDADFDSRQVLPFEDPARVWLYVPPHKLSQITRELTPSLKRGRLSIQAFDLDLWPDV